MKAILIDAPARRVSEIDFDDSVPSAVPELLGSKLFSSTFYRQHEIIIFLPDGDTRHGFVMPLDKGHVRGKGKAIIIGSVGGRSVDTMLSPLSVERGLFWTGEQA